MLYVAGPIGTFAILIIRSADDATELTASWVSLIGAFKFITAQYTYYLMAVVEIVNGSQVCLVPD